MPFQKITPERLSNAVVRQIEKLILQGILRPGERLPSERELAETLDVSRPSLREAFSDLQASGLLVARPGSGVFVADVLGSAFSPALIRLFASHEDAVFDYLAFRKDLEGMAAARAAEVGSNTDLQVIDTIYRKMEAAQSKRSSDHQAQLDAQFHMSIFEASHNVVMLHMMRSMYDLLREGVFYNRQATFVQSAGRDTLLAQHSDINTALQNRDAQGAKQAVEQHLDYVAGVLRQHQKAQENEMVAQQRFEHESTL